MFSIAILIGIYSYSIFSLGLLGLLYKELILFFTLFFFAVVFYAYRNKISTIRLKEIMRLLDEKIPRIFLLLLLIQILVNLAGALGPELSFDALWYHLTLPKIYLENQKIIHIPGGLLYYSDMPKLTEMIYVSSLSLFNEISAKIVHFSFGILTLIAIYKLARKFLDQKFSALASVIFYANLVVGWQSTTAYVDLARTFFEIMALWGFINYMRSPNSSATRGWFIESAVMLGLAISTKLLSIGSLFIFLFLIIFINRKIDKEVISKLILYSCISLYVVLSWFLFSFLNTGNPIYPVFSSYYKVGFDATIFNPLIFLKDQWNLFTHSADSISPIYIIFLPLVLIYFRKFNPQIKIMAIYFLLSLIIWYFTPQKGARFILPYLPALSIVVSYTIAQISKDSFFKNLSIIIIIFVSVLSIVYRGLANSKYLPVLFGKQTKDEFLTNHLNFNYGDFYDTDGYFKTHVNRADKVLLYAFHNLYYVNFPFIDSSYVKSGDRFNYIAVQNSKLPDRFKFWKLVYSNSKTHVKLYSLGGQEWIY